MPKLLIKLFSRLNVVVYLLSRGLIGGSAIGLPIFLLTTTGRRSGKRRTTPLSYLRDSSRYVIVGSLGGHPVHPAWFLNLRANPKVTIRLKSRRISMIARVADGEKKEGLWSKLMEVAPYYGRYQARTTRNIPLVILEPASGE